MTFADLTLRTSALLDPAQTAARLPYPLLVEEINRLLRDSSVQVPPRLVQPLPGGGALFVMPALDARTAITKLITFTPGNASRGLATIQGDLVVFDVATGQRKLVGTARARNGPEGARGAGPQCGAGRLPDHSHLHTGPRRSAWQPAAQRCLHCRSRCLHTARG